MNILYITSQFYPVQNAVSIRAKFHIDALLDLKAKVNIITTAASRKFGFYSIIPVGLNFPTNDSKLPKRLLFEFGIGMLMLGRILTSKKPDLVIVTSPPFFMAAISCVGARLRGVPYVLDVRDRYPEVLFALGLCKRDGALGRILRKIEVELYKRASLVVTVTTALSESIERETSCRPKVIMNGYDLSLFSRSVKKSSKSKDVKIVMHGTFGRFFDIGAFYRIASHCNDRALPHHFILAGCGPKLLDVKLFDLPNVNVLGSITQPQVAELLLTADIGLSIHTEDESMMNAFPVKIFEYIGACLPSVVIPRSIGGMYVHSHRMGWAFAGSDWLAAAEHMTLLIGVREMRIDCSNNIRRLRLGLTRNAQAAKFAGHVLALDLNRGRKW